MPCRKLVYIPERLIEASNDTPFDLPPRDMARSPFDGVTVTPPPHDIEVQRRYDRRDAARAEIARMLRPAPTD